MTDMKNIKNQHWRKQQTREPYTKRKINWFTWFKAYLHPWWEKDSTML